ncbi:MAG: diguanylate cyclase [Myxococcota bacterium]
MDSHHILIVDDDPGAIQLLRSMLSEYPVVRFATNGIDALRLARETPPDLVLLDAEMPGMTGFDVCRELKADPALADVPVLFVTAHDDLAFESRALMLGAADFITKPLSALRVTLRIKLHLKLKQQVDALRTVAGTDGLTQLANRRVIDDALEREWRSARRSGQPLSLIMVDVDYFKNYNDAYGHPAGDECLRTIARLLRDSARRPRDLVGRYGGEEFVVLMPDTPESGARHVGAELRATIAAAAIPHCASGVAPHVTISVGVASAVSSDAIDARGLVEAADKALYTAKQLGRDRVAYVALR